jgi:hypothetical protein
VRFSPVQSTRSECSEQRITPNFLKDRLSRRFQRLQLCHLIAAAFPAEYFSVNHGLVQVSIWGNSKTPKSPEMSEKPRA